MWNLTLTLIERILYVIWGLHLPRAQFKMRFFFLIAGIDKVAANNFVICVIFIFFFLKLNCHMQNVNSFKLLWYYLPP